METWTKTCGPLENDPHPGVLSDLLPVSADLHLALDARLHRGAVLYHQDVAAGGPDPRGH